MDLSDHVELANDVRKVTLGHFSECTILVMLCIFTLN